MAKSKYLTAPLPSTKMPAGIPYILTNEAAERFAFYGMTSILVIFMTKYLMSREGTLAVMGDEQAKTWFHLFNSAVYFLPFVGALIADIWLAKYRTVIYFCLVYCVGFIAITLDHTRLGLGLGLVLIAIGSGIIKPCVSANVGDQFGKTNEHLISKFYAWFYFSINLGACISMFICPWLLDWYGPLIGFGVPAALMIAATIAYWLGRKKFVHIPAAGLGFVRETFSGEGLRAVGRLAILYLFIAMFWSLFYQSQSAWVLQAESMNLKWLGFNWLPEQPQAINPFLIMVMIPLFSYVIYPAMNKVFSLTSLRKIIIGLFVVAISFVVSASIEVRINGGEIFKCSSRSTVARVEPFRLLDGQTDDAGWSSGKSPEVNEPVELVVRLRERRSWTISAIEFAPSAVLSQAEISAALSDLSFRTLQQVKKTKEGGQLVEDRLERLAGKAEILKAAARRARKAPNPEAAKTIAAEVLGEVGADANLLQEELYGPRKLSVFAADFSGRLLPKLLFEVDDEQRQEVTSPIEFARKSGWVNIGTFELPRSGAIQQFQFEPISATHVLVQIESNHGADRVKISEIRVLTDEPVPPQSQAFAAEVWPNVAAIGFKPPIAWQFVAYVILTAAEVMVSITCLEFSYTQAPKKMKSLIQAVFLLSISVGNAFTAAVNAFIQNEDGSSKLAGASYYWFFVIAMLVTAVLFIPVAARYKVKDYIQDEAASQA